MSIVQEIRRSLVTDPHEYRAQKTQQGGILRQADDYVAMRKNLVPDSMPYHPALEQLAGYGEIARRASVAFFAFDKAIMDQFIRAGRQRTELGEVERRVEAVKEYNHDKR